MCIVKIDVSAETREAFEGKEDDQVFEATPQKPTNEKEPKIKEVVIDFN